MKKAIVIGSGFSGLSTAAFLAKAGFQVKVVEKNTELGGRARMKKINGYSFDMGPSWYWMPDIFEVFFNEFNFEIDSLYKLIKLDPGFKMVFADDEISIPADFQQTCEIFEKYEKGAGIKLQEFIEDAKKKYNIGINFMYNAPGLSLLELFNKEIIRNITSFQLLTSYRKHIKAYFSHPKLITLLEFPVLFLGASAAKTPALYSLMSYSAFKQGTFYPIGGFNCVIKAIVKLCKELGVIFLCNEEVIKINLTNNKATSVLTKSKQILKTNFVISAADYTHVESGLIPKRYRNYSEKYWEKKSFSPSALIFYLGIQKKLKNLIHHNLFFDEDVENFTQDIYEFKAWPKKPLFYVCCPSKTDESVAPKNKENIFILMPIPIGVKDTQALRKKYFNILISKLEAYCQQEIVSHIEYQKSYCIKDFESDYNSYKGNAYGLANILSQTANLKPKIINKKICNLFYAGQLTVPGPGVPPALISGKIVANQIIKSLK
ncbi:MAG: phytoene desaturase family protein [Bacteroidota bacterium]|nr:phytoene desaturase family protein [Bacteroidota bacterium]